jgi:hypothetical protein
LIVLLKSNFFCFYLLEEKNPPKIQRVHLNRTFETRLNRPILTQPQNSTSPARSNHQMESRKYGSSNDISLSKVLRPSAAYVAQDPETDVFVFFFSISII